MHGPVAPPPVTPRTDLAKPHTLLPVLAALNAIGPAGIYLLLPALPVLVAEFGRDLSIAQMTISFYMVGIAVSQISMGSLSDRFGRRPVVLAGIGLAALASIGCIFAQTLPQLIAARFFQAVGAGCGMAIGRAIVRDLFDRNRTSSMISLVIAASTISQMVSPLIGGLLEVRFGWPSIFYFLTVVALLLMTIVAVTLPETRRVLATEKTGFGRDIRLLFTTRAYIGYLLCMVLSSQIVFVFAGGGAYIVITHMGRSSVEYGAWFATLSIAYLAGSVCNARLARSYSLESLIWLGLAMQLAGSLLNLLWGSLGFNDLPSWLFITQMLVMLGNGFVISNSMAGAISIRPQAAGTASGVLGFLQMSTGALSSQLGAYLGGHFETTVPLNADILALSLACAAAMLFIVPRRDWGLPHGFGQG